MKYSILILSIFIGFCFAILALLQTKQPDYSEEAIDELKSNCMGCIVPRNPNEGWDAAEFIHKDPNSKIYLSNILGSNDCNYKVDKILNYSTQLVAGTLFRVEYKITGNGCKDLICKAQIWEKPWLNFKEVSNYAKGLKNLNHKFF